MRAECASDSVRGLVNSNTVFAYVLSFSLFFALAMLTSPADLLAATEGSFGIGNVSNNDGLSGQESSNTASKNVPMDFVISELSTWISAKTGLPPVHPPQIEFVTTPRMTEIAVGPGIAANPQLRALYNNRTKIIYLRANWSEVSLGDRSELVHELVHHFQNVHKQTYQCGAAREELAYDLQIRWLKEQGVSDPYELLQLNHFYIVMASACRDVDHD